MNSVMTGPSWTPPGSEGSPTLLCSYLVTTLNPPGCHFLLLGKETVDTVKQDLSIYIQTQELFLMHTVKKMPINLTVN